VAVAITGTILLLLYVFWYSRLGRVPNARLEIRNKLPEFELTDFEGRRIHSSEVLGAPTVWLFYRGNWDPFCVAQVHEIAARHADLEKLGARLNLVSAQPMDRVRELASEVGASLNFMFDQDARAAHVLDISERHPIPPGKVGGYAPVGAMPTVIVTNASGTILYTDQTDNYRVRPEPDIYISILRRAGAVAR
jgi:peroxiredoxin